MKHREQLIKTYKEKGQLNGLGYMLDDINDWDIVIENKILDLRSQGFNRVSVQNAVESEYTKYVEFVFLYHI